MTFKGYVHGYSAREAERLLDQAQTLTELLHHDTAYPAGSRVLEAGCGIGAQTVTLAQHSPGAQITSIDVSESSLGQARARVGEAGIDNVTFRQADIYALPFADASFDHILICLVLEHLPDPVGALACLCRVLRPGGTITVIEGDHGSCYFHPETPAARAAWQCLIEVQAGIKGDHLIGRRLYPLLDGAGFSAITVSPRMVYVDKSRPALVDGFIRKTIIAMVEGVKEQAIAQGMIDEETWEQGITDLHLTAAPGGTFRYTFFKATGKR